MTGSIQRRMSERTGRITYRVRVHVGRAEAERLGLPKIGWYYGGSFKRLRAKEDEPCAERALEELKKQLAGGHVDLCADTLAALSERWLRDCVAPDSRDNTIRAHRKALDDHILPVTVRVDSEPEKLGDIIGSKVTPADVAEWQAAQLAGGRKDGKSGGCAVKSVRNYRGTLHKLFSWLQAVMPETFASNPVATVKAPRWKRRPPQPPTLTSAQQYVESLRPTRLWPAMIIGSTTGMRRGEVLALRWRDVRWHALKDSESGAVSLRGQLVIDAERGNLTGRTRATLKFGPPKTDKGARLVPLTEPTVAALIEIKAERSRSMSPGAPWDDEALVCCGRRGQPIIPDGFTHELATRLRSRKLPPVSFHKLRHMVATEMRRAGVPATVLADFLGHADVATTAVYDHVDEADQQDAAERFQAAWEASAERQRVQTASKMAPLGDLAAKRACK